MLSMYTYPFDEENNVILVINTFNFYSTRYPLSALVTAYGSIERNAGICQEFNVIGHCCYQSVVIFENRYVF